MTISTPSLYAAHDANLIRLPENVLKVRDAHARASEALTALTPPQHPVDVRTEVAHETAAAYLSGAPAPSVDRVLDAERGARVFDHSLEVGRATVLMLEARLTEVLTAAAETIIVDSLRPPFDSTVASMRAGFNMLEPFETAGRGALALASAKVRKAAADLDGTLVPNYNLLRTAAAELRKVLPPPEHDGDGEFAAFRDVEMVWPRARRTNFGALPAPWAEAPDPLAWQIRNLTAWLPTPAEQDAAWLEVHGGLLEKQAERVRLHQEARGMAGLNVG